LNAIHQIPGWLPWVIPAFLLLITPIVFFHELGHFLVARFFGVKIETFSIGFGREIFGWTDRHGTRWKVSALPLGGYVRFLGDADALGTPDPEAVAKLSRDEQSRSFVSKPVYQRALIAAAGPITNFLLAIAIFSAMFMTVGRFVVPARVDSVVPNSAAAAAGIRAGDRVLAIDGERVSSYEELQQIVASDGGRTIAITLERKSRTFTVDATPKLTDVTDRFGNKYKIGRLGIATLGVVSPIRYGPLGAVAAACDEIRIIIQSTLRARAQLFAGNTSQLSGVIGIAKLSGQVASESWLGLVGLAALISVSIGFINLFPIPPLDGGLLLYYAFEALLGRPLGERAQDLGFRVGLAVVFGLMILATWNDLARLNLF
jgi:regulator of sigma E protease